MAEFLLGDSEKIVTAQFPAGMEGSDVYYTIYNQDKTVAVSRRNTGMVEYGKGFFALDVQTLLIAVGEYVIIFDIDEVRFAPEKIQVRNEEIEQREFTEYNANKSVKKVIIKKTRTNDFSDSHSSKELDFDYNSDETVSKMEESRS